MKFLSASSAQLMKDASQIFDRWKDHVIGWDDVLLRSFE